MGKPDYVDNIRVYASPHIFFVRFGLSANFINDTTFYVKVKFKVRAI